MPVGLDHPQSLLIIEGIRLSASSADIYKEKRNDIALIEISDDGAVSYTHLTLPTSDLV